jgi:hypothetical protein
MLKKVLLVAVMGPALIGCGNICSRADNAYEDLKAKVRPCAEQGFAVDEFDVNQCEDKADECSDTDRESLEGYLDCLESMSTCQPTNTDLFVDEAEICAAKLKSVSFPCSSPF